VRAVLLIHQCGPQAGAVGKCFCSGLKARINAPFRRGGGLRGNPAPACRSRRRDQCFGRGDMPCPRRRPGPQADLSDWRSVSGFDRNLFQPRFAVASVAMGVIEHAAQHPVLGCHVPIAPRIAAHIVRSASGADNADFGCFLCLGHSRIMAPIE
jgi:hypothetical protein